MKIKDIFIAFSYHQITDEELYISEGEIPVFTGNGDIKGYWSNTFTSQINDILPCIAFALKGNNTGHSYIIDFPFDANNTGLLVARKEFKQELNLRWFTYKLRSILIKVQTNKEGVSFINKEILENINIELPKLTIQDKELEHYEKLDKIRSKYQNYLDRCSNLLSKDIIFNSFRDEIQLSGVLSYVSRNDALSEEGLYNLEKSRFNNITVLSGSIDNIYYGEIPFDTEGIHFLKDRAVIHIVTRGKAGKLTFLKKGTYATNTNAFILYLNDSIKADVGVETEIDEMYYLKFLKIYLEPLFLNISSNSDVSVFPLTKVFTDMIIPKFILNDEIKSIVDKFDSLYMVTENLINQIGKIDRLLEKEIIQVPNP